MKYEVFMFGCKSIAERGIFYFKGLANDNDKVNGMSVKILRDFSKYWGD